MKTYLVAAALLGLGALPAFGAAAQKTSDPGDAKSVEVTFGEFTYTLFADEPVQACVTSREDGQSGASLAYRLFIREPDGSFSSVGTYPSPEIGALVGAKFGDCMSLEGFDNAGPS